MRLLQGQAKSRTSYVIVKMSRSLEEVIRSYWNNNELEVSKYVTSNVVN